MPDPLKIINVKLDELEIKKFWGKVVIEYKGGMPVALKLEETIVLTQHATKKEKTKKTLDNKI